MRRDQGSFKDLKSCLKLVSDSVGLICQPQEQQKEEEEGCQESSSWCRRHRLNDLDLKLSLLSRQFCLLSTTITCTTTCVPSPSSSFLSSFMTFELVQVSYSFSPSSSTSNEPRNNSTVLESIERRWFVLPGARRAIQSRRGRVLKLSGRKPHSALSSASSHSFNGARARYGWVLRRLAVLVLTPAIESGFFTFVHLLYRRHFFARITGPACSPK